MKFLVVSDNKFLINQFQQILLKKDLYKNNSWHFSCSPANKALLVDKDLSVTVDSVNMKTEYAELASEYDMIFSLHCKQLFPAELVQKVKCINVHPGFNPYNRGWFPQVFSILNKMKSGATIHEIDEELDHGPVIVQREVKIENWDTSLTAYNKIQHAEVELLNENLEKIIERNYKPLIPAEEGNVNLKKDFNGLCEINMNKPTTMGGAIEYLRAMSHGSYMNAWFTDEATGKKVYVKIDLQTE